MKAKQLISLISGGVLALASGVAAAAISGTAHDFSSTGSGQKATWSNGASEICVFCHTPHGADVSVDGLPLWNRTAAGPSTYQVYATTSTLDGKIESVGSVSLACLSCHDGTQAIGSVINTPGTGSGSTTTWAGTSVGGSTGGMVSGTYANLTKDLRNDHPIGIQYAGGGYSYNGGSTVTVGTMKDLDFKALAYSANATTNRAQFWVDTSGGTSGTKEKTDLLLYVRATSSVTGVEPLVECATCHDPHTSTALFMRMTGGNQNSQLCLACHTK